MNKQNKAERLFDAIGGIDDYLIAEALTPPVKIKPRVKFGRGAKLAVSFALSLTVIVGASLAFLRGNFDKDSFEPMEDGEDLVQTVTLESVVMSVQNDRHIKTLSEDEISFFSSRMKIIWCYEGDEKYRVVSVPSSEEEKLIRAIDELANAPKTNKAGDMPYAIWICYEDGRVITPYLESSAGNVGYAELFEYSPEIEPNSAFTELINELIG